MEVVGTLKRVCPSLEHIKLDKKRAELFPDLLKVLECHSKSTDYMIQFFKEPLVQNCSCNGCNNRVIKPVRMPRSVYEKVMEFPMPMPILKPIGLLDKASDVQYLSFADAKKLPFTNEFQSSLEKVSLRAAANKKKKSSATRHLSVARSWFCFKHYQAKNQV